MGTAAAVPRPATLGYPAVNSEIRGLSQVEPVVETTMVGTGKGDHELASFLRGRGGGAWRECKPQSRPHSAIEKKCIKRQVGR